MFAGELHLDRIAAVADTRHGAEVSEIESWPAPEGLAAKPDSSALIEFVLEARARLAGDMDAIGVNVSFVFCACLLDSDFGKFLN